MEAAALQIKVFVEPFVQEPGVGGIGVSLAEGWQYNAAIYTMA